MSDRLRSLMRVQHGLVARRQLLGGDDPILTPAAVRARLARDWQVVLPGVYATFTGGLAQPQRMRAALLHAGPAAMLNAESVLWLYRVRALPAATGAVRVLVPARTAPTSRDFVDVRRTTRLPRPLNVEGFPCAPPARAAVEFALVTPQLRDVCAVLTEVVQRGLVTVSSLREEHALAPARGRGPATTVIGEIEAGVRSNGEASFRRLVLGRRGLPEPLWNPLLRLPDGRLVSPDALIVDARLIHETNGHRYHSGVEEFADMQVRHDVLTAAGFTVLHNPPLRLERQPRAVLEEFEACYLRLQGLGLPPGVTLLRAGPSC